MKILIADDDVVSRTLLQRTLERMQHEVTAVSDGLEAIRVGALPDAPKLAVLDWMMPGATASPSAAPSGARMGPTSM